jgi:hypothetical protein
VDHGIETRIEVHHAFGPQQGNQLFARDNTAGVSNQLLQHLHRLLLQADSGPSALEITRFGVEHPSIEAEFPAAHARSAPDQS